MNLKQKNIFSTKLRYKILFSLFWLIFVKVLVLAEEGKKFVNDIEQVPLPKAVEVMKHICATPTSVNLKNKAYATCNWCPNESTSRNKSMVLGNLIFGNFSGNGDEALIDMRSCERERFGYEGWPDRNFSLLLIDLKKSTYSYFPGNIPIMDEQCVKFSTESNKDVLVCSYTVYGNDYPGGNIAQYYFDGKNWMGKSLMQTIVPQFGGFGISLIGFKKIIDEGFFSDVKKLVIHLSVGDSESTKEYELLYTLNGINFELDDSSRNDKIYILSLRP